MSPKTQSLTQSLTPAQEKCVLGFDLIQFSSKNTIASTDSTFSTLQALETATEDNLKEFLSKAVTNQFHYSLFTCAANRLLASDVENATTIINKLISIETQNLPAFSNLLAWQNLKDLLSNLSESYFSSISTFEVFEETFKKFVNSGKIMHTTILYLAAYSHFKEDKKQLKILAMSLNSFVQSYTNNIKFPKAEASNHYLINPLLNLLIFLWSDETVQGLLEIGKALNSYCKSTYHNSKVVKLLCLNAIKNNRLKECLATFRTYVDYIKDFKIKHKGVYDDVLDSISLYVSVLQHYSKHIKTFDNFREIDRFYLELIELVDDFLLYFVTDQAEYHIPELQNYMNFVYTGIAEIYEDCMAYRAVSTETQISAMIDLTSKAIKSVYSKTHSVNKIQLSENYFKNSYYLHKSGNDKLAIRRIKKALINNPNNVSFLTFLIKLYSGDEETYEIALQLARDALLQTVSMEGGSSLKLKADISELYLVYLTLLGPESPPLLEDFFGRMNSLFDEKFKVLDVNEKTSAKAVVQKSQPSAKVPNTNFGEDGCSPCEPTKPKNWLNKKASISKNIVKVSNGHVRQQSSATDKLKNGSSRALSNKNAESKVLQKIWLSISRLLQSYGSFEAALEAVDAAETFGRDGDVYARRGCLLIAEGDLPNGVMWIEKSLESNNASAEGNAEALLGLLSSSVLSESRQRALSGLRGVANRVQFVRDIQILMALDELSLATRAWTGVKIL